MCFAIKDLIERSWLEAKHIKLLKLRDNYVAGQTASQKKASSRVLCVLMQKLFPQLKKVLIIIRFDDYTFTLNLLIALLKQWKDHLTTLVFDVRISKS